MAYAAEASRYLVILILFLLGATGVDWMIDGYTSGALLTGSVSAILIVIFFGGERGQ